MVNICTRSIYEKLGANRHEPNQQVRESQQSEQVVSGTSSQANSLVEQPMAEDPSRHCGKRELRSQRVRECVCLFAERGRGICSLDRARRSRSADSGLFRHTWCITMLGVKRNWWIFKNDLMKYRRRVVGKEKSDTSLRDTWRPCMSPDSACFSIIDRKDDVRYWRDRFFKEGEVGMLTFEGLVDAQASMVHESLQ